MQVLSKNAKIANFVPTPGREAKWQILHRLITSNANASKIAKPANMANGTPANY